MCQDPAVPSGKIQNRAPEHQREELSHILLHAGWPVVRTQGQAGPQGCQSLQIPNRGKLLNYIISKNQVDQKFYLIFLLTKLH